MPARKLKEVYESTDHLFFPGSFTCVKCGSSVSASRDTKCIIVKESELRGKVAA